ncbi:MAG TPA: UDP-3-O-(3-hydroxymyristoyl)glucosamine N-acyltransferase [Bacteroidales bacterium]|jgi:UDP-3-O-[3-hydroxymyristoyl] glucosamine N-acyltransferase|nr:UDP-3-O-(3-hydroxymyristoyl)glucosamine N-acyltransferase [Bacteroidales bacterium]
MEFKAREIAAMIGGIIEGNPEIVITKLSKIEDGEPGSLSFLANPKYEPYIYTTKAAVVIIRSDFKAEQPLPCSVIKVDDPYTAIAVLLDMYSKMYKPRTGISSLAFISASAKTGKDIFIGEFVYVGENVVIADDVKIYPQVYLGDNVKVGEGTILYPGVKIYHDCEIGKNCTIHAGVVLGADGFGFAPQDDNNYMKIAQIGNVIIEDNVEIGANTTIDRATMGSTTIRKGVKLDNLIQVGHNGEVGENTVIAAQTGIAGSTRVGRNCMIGGQVGFAGHISIADDVKIGAQAGVPNNVTKPGTILLGAPAIEIGRFRRSIAIFNNLEKLVQRVSELEKKLAEVTNGQEKK